MTTNPNRIRRIQTKRRSRNPGRTKRSRTQGRIQTMRKIPGTQTTKEIPRTQAMSKSCILLVLLLAGFELPRPWCRKQGWWRSSWWDHWLVVLANYVSTCLQLMSDMRIWPILYPMMFDCFVKIHLVFTQIFLPSLQCLANAFLDSFIPLILSTVLIRCTFCLSKNFYHGFNAMHMPFFCSSLSFQFKGFAACKYISWF